MDNVYFIFNTKLVDAIEDLIQDSKGELLLISPFIDLSPRIRSILNEKKGLHDFKLRVLFGKNEDNIYNSVKKDSFDFLKEFPNIEIRYNPLLHAKFYQSDTSFIMTSINLYDYSLATNIEVGVICEYAEPGYINKAIEGVLNNIGDGIDKVKGDLLGTKKEIDPMEKFANIYAESELMFKSEPIIGNKKGISGLIGGKELKDRNIILDNLKGQVKGKKPSSKEPAKKLKPSLKSASQISKSKGVSQSIITELMQNAGYIKDNSITALGKNNGLEMKSYMGNEYIAYPMNLKELQDS